MNLNPLHPPMSHFQIYCKRWQSQSGVCQTIRHPENQSSHEIVCSILTVWPTTLLWPYGKMRLSQTPWCSGLLYHSHKSVLPIWQLLSVVSKPFGLHTNPSVERWISHEHIHVGCFALSHPQSSQDLSEGPHTCKEIIDFILVNIYLSRRISLEQILICNDSLYKGVNTCIVSWFF